MRSQTCPVITLHLIITEDLLNSVGELVSIGSRP